jgi:hypothetical protein
VGRNTIADFTKVIVRDVPALSGKKISNKTGRGVGITHLNEGMVPIEKAMEATGHRSMDAFEKYNREKKFISEHAMQRVLSGEFRNGRPLLYQDAYKEECERYETKVGHDLVL